MVNQVLDNALINQVAVYWPPTAFDKFGQREAGTPVEVKCHWENVAAKQIEVEGEVFTITAVIYMANPVEIGGWMWLSNAKLTDPAGTALLAAPATAPQKQKVLGLDTVPDVDAEETMYRARI